MDSLQKNTALTDIDLKGNRFTHACLAKIQKIAHRNIRDIEKQEPNKLKGEIDRLKYENGQMLKTKTLVDKKKKEVNQVI